MCVEQSRARKMVRRRRRRHAGHRATKVDVTKCHAYHAKRRWMSPHATPTTPAEDRCHHMQLLPRLPKIDVTKCHACETKVDALPVLQPRTLIDKVV